MKTDTNLNLGSRHLLAWVVSFVLYVAAAPAALGLICRTNDPPDTPSDCNRCSPPKEDSAMPVFSVALPWVNVHLGDTPVSYTPSRGFPVSFHIVYGQRPVMPEDPLIFGLGTNWATSFRAYLLDASSVQNGLFRLHRDDLLDRHANYFVGTPQFDDSSLLSTPDSGQTYQIEYASGAVDVFGKRFTNSSGYIVFFLTTRRDPASNAITFNYATNQNIVRLSSVTDPDGRSTQLYYENTTFTNQITQVVDPFNRTNLLKYDASGYLTNTTDVIGLSSSFVYDAGPRRGWITNLVTPYGTTVFRYGGVDADSSEFFSGNNQVNRFVEITQPNGGKHLYLYRHDCSGFMSASIQSVPDTSPFPNTLDNVDQNQRNTFHWSPLQCVGLSTTNVANLTTDDYKLAGLRHWLRDSQTGNPSHVASLARAPSQDGTTLGQMTWFDHPGKPSGKNSTNGTSALPCLEGRVLPGGTTRYECGTPNSRGSLTNQSFTYSATNGTVVVGTNTFLFTAGEIDLLKHVGAQGEQVVSNYFNAYHQPLISYNALNEATTYTYNANRQLTSIVRPSGLRRKGSSQNV